MEQEDEPDWQGIWERIVADAEQHIEEWNRQAEWLAQGGQLPGPDEWHAAQRRAGKAFIRQWAQQVDLARAINEDDIASYIEAWYPAPSPNGPTTWSLTLTTEVSYDEYEAFVSTLYEHPNCRRDFTPDTGDTAAVRRKLAARGRKKRQPQTSTPYVKHVPTGQEGARGVGPGPSLRDWARRLRRRR
jgi:hypothetical protein